MNEVKLKAALAHIGEGFYKLADAIESAPTTESEASEQLEPPLDEPETEAPKKKPAAKKKAVKKKAAKKVSSLHTSDDLVTLLNEKSKDGKRKEALEVLGGRKVADLSEDELQEVYAEVGKL